MKTALRNSLAVIVGMVVGGVVIMLFEKLGDMAREAIQTAGGIYTVNSFPHPEWFTYLGPAVFVPLALLGAWSSRQLRT